MTDRKKSERGVFESMGESAGRIAGKVTDTAFNATGAVFDSMTSMLGSWWSGSEAKRAANSFGESQDRACRQHFQSRTTRSDTANAYERTRPFYQFGHVAGQNPDYQGRSFDEIEQDLRTAWESGVSRDHGSWDDVRDYVGYGYGTGSPGLGDNDVTNRSGTEWRDRERGGGI